MLSNQLALSRLFYRSSYIIYNSAAVRFRDRLCCSVEIINPTACHVCANDLQEHIYASENFQAFFLRLNCRRFNPAAVFSVSTTKTNLRHAFRRSESSALEGTRARKFSLFIASCRESSRVAARPPELTLSRACIVPTYPRSYRSRMYNRPTLCPSSVRSGVRNAVLS